MVPAFRQKDVWYHCGTLHRNISNAATSSSHKSAPWFPSPSESVRDREQSHCELATGQETLKAGSNAHYCNNTSIFTK